MKKLVKILFLAYLISFTLSCSACGNKNEIINNSKKIQPNLTLTVHGMTCNSCKVAIENELKKIAGVKNAIAIYGQSIDNVLIEYDEKKTSKKALIEAIENTGYTVSNKD